MQLAKKLLLKVKLKKKKLLNQNLNLAQLLVNHTVAANKKTKPKLMKLHV